jgi:thioredoxin-like negative regulator of GroEL
LKESNEIKQLMAAGETARADEALKELLVEEPNNLQAKMLYGTCHQLLGDEETFKRIHDELEPQMSKLDVWTPYQVETLSLWKILAGVGVGVWRLGVLLG